MSVHARHTHFRIIAKWSQCSSRRRRRRRRWNIKREKISNINGILFIDGVVERRFMHTIFYLLAGLFFFCRVFSTLNAFRSYQSLAAAAFVCARVRDDKHDRSPYRRHRDEAVNIVVFSFWPLAFVLSIGRSVGRSSSCSGSFFLEFRSIIFQSPFWADLCFCCGQVMPFTLMSLSFSFYSLGNRMKWYVKQKREKKITSSNSLLCACTRNACTACGGQADRNEKKNERKENNN